MRITSQEDARALTEITGQQLAAKRPRRWFAAELIVAACLTAFVVVLHVRHFFHAGPLWRDEISTVQIANSPTLRDVYYNKINDSAPMLWDLVVRAWTHLGPGKSDRGLRLLSLIVALATVGALWLNVRILGAPSPIVSLVLLGLNGDVICYGESLRAYGPAMLAGLLCTTAVLNFSRESDNRSVRKAFAMALVAALATVQTSYLGTIWVLAACTGAVAVCAMYGRWKRAAAVVGMGAICAASLIIYAHVRQTRAGWDPLIVYKTSISRVIAVLQFALRHVPVGENPGGTLIWEVTVVVAMGIGCIGLWSTRRDGSTGVSGRRRSALMFCAVTLPTGVIAYLFVLWALRDSLSHFHFLLLFPLMATCLDGLLAQVVRTAARYVLIALVCGTAILWCGDAWRSAGVRMSNVDLIAKRLQTLAHPGDLIIIDPWWIGSSVARYYHGPGDLLTVPPLTDLVYPRYDLVVPMLANPHAIDPVLQRIAATFKAGRKVWMIIHPMFRLAVDPRTSLPVPSPTWNDTEYYGLWTSQIALALQRDSGVRATKHLAVNGGADINPNEDLRLLEPLR